jgi:hypothetical protein
MKSTLRVALSVAPVLFVLSSCGIPATGVVEAGGPASGIVPVTPVYFVRDGALVAFTRPTAEPGDPDAALELLLRGPLPEEVLRGVSTQVPVPQKAAMRTLSVSVHGGALSVELPTGMGRLSGLATQQLICTAAAAHRLTTPSADPLTADVTDGSGRHAKGSDERCPAP